MYTNLRVYLISPDKIVVYAFDNPDDNTNYIYNGGSLEIISSPEISSYTEISGSSTPDFKTDPLVLGYADGLFEIVYAPSDMDTVFTSNGAPAQHRNVPITAKSMLKIPDTEKRDAGPNAPKLVPFELDAPNFKSVQKYINMAKKGEEYSSHDTYWEARSKSAEKALPNLTIARLPAPPLFTAPVQPALPVAAPVQPALPVVAPVQVVPKDVTQEEWYQHLKKEIDELKSQREELTIILEKLTRRIYKIYPVNLPDTIKVGDSTGTVVSVSEINEKMANGDIESMTLEPRLQAYAGSHRGDNRLLTFYAKDGKIYHVRAKYNVKDNSFNEPE